MSVKVHLYSGLKGCTNGKNVVEVHGSTVGECLTDLVEQFPKMKQELFEKNGKLSGAVLVSVNLKSAYPEELANPVDPNDGFAAAKISALQQDNQRLQVSVNDFKNGMTLAKQQAIEIQMTTNNARSILEEFERAKTTVIPALKSLLAQHLISIEQKHAIETDNLLRETLASAMIAQTQLTSENTVQLATLQQKSTISVQTLDDCQKILEDTALKVKEIEEAGRKQRIEDATKRADIEKRLLASVRNS